ncbi:alpha/beta fold hydrolase [Candidatus Wolfebacteria bacterium]|nr:alpha/beta fold hydrolase [Candidatus Wolfebacteria bacterium]
MPQKIFLKTQDGVKIAANLYTAKNPIGWLVLIHMMPSTKESWESFAKELQNSEYEDITIDLRGHGESSSGPEGFLNFSDSEHQKSILDLQAAVDYLTKERNAAPEKISFIGASIGANLSLQYISENPDFKTAALLSPGLNYRGLKTEPLVKNLKKDQNIFFISANDDGNNAEQTQKLYELMPNDINKKIEIYKTGGHGTNILSNQPKLKNLIIGFLKD